MANSDYNIASKTLHKFALQSTAIAEISFDIENTLIKKEANKFPNNHVYISGLARSGTTILMKSLFETGQFVSLNYADMPFLLMPNIWKRINKGKRSSETKERAHGDNIQVGYDSPEALEELFWKVFTGEKYIFSDRLQKYAVKDDVIEKYRDYIYNILHSGKAESGLRYISKSNNQILRINEIYKAFPQAVVVLPFRSPLQHANSLLTQHIHFSKIHSEDKFSLQYMNWLGHFEFGNNQKSFLLDDEKLFNEMKNFAKTDLNFWLLNWKNYYQHVINNSFENVILFNYDKFCINPVNELEQLFKKVNVQSELAPIEPYVHPEKKLTNFDQTILDECNIIYQSLEARYENQYL